MTKKSTKEQNRILREFLDKEFEDKKLTAVGVLRLIIGEALPGEDLPDSLTACLKLLRDHRKFVNIYDFTRWHRRQAQTLHVCSSIPELRSRCKLKGFYPLHDAKAQPELKKLLQVLFR